jgi:hypothetical protein
VSVLALIIWQAVCVIFLFTLTAAVLGEVLKVHKHFCCVWGRWKLENWHLYRYREHQAVNNPGIRRHDWDRLL